MYRVNDFDPEKYIQFLEEFGKCRRSVKSSKIFEHLSIITPSSNMSFELKNHLDKYCNTNRKTGWGPCVKPAQKIRDFLLEKK